MHDRRADSSAGLHPLPAFEGPPPDDVFDLIGRWQRYLEISGTPQRDRSPAVPADAPRVLRRPLDVGVGSRSHALRRDRGRRHRLPGEPERAWRFPGDAAALAQELP